MYYTVCYFTCIFYAVIRQVSMLFIDNKDSVFCTHTHTHTHTESHTFTTGQLSTARILFLVSQRLQPQNERCQLIKAHRSSGEITGEHFQFKEYWCKSVVLSLIWLHSLVCWIHNKKNVTTGSLQWQYLCLSCYHVMSVGVDRAMLSLHNYYANASPFFNYSPPPTPPFKTTLGLPA